jgi:pimeloyl-ACP methyl ester carboxylesterase
LSGSAKGDVMLAHDRLGAGPPLLLLHHLGGTRAAWDPVRGALAARHETVAVDLPGFGASPPLAGAPTVPALADAVAAALEALGLERPAAAGVSLGGGIALELAARGLVRSTTAISPLGFGAPREVAYARASLRATLAFARAIGGTAPALAALAPARTLFGWQVYGRPWRVPAGVMAAAAADLRGAPSAAAAIGAAAGWRAPAIPAEVPVTLLWGARDALLLPRQGRRALQRLPHARLLVLSGCGHLPFHDDAAAVAGALLAGTAR